MKFKPLAENALGELDDIKHDALRKKMAAGYSGKENPSLEQSIDNQIKHMVFLIERTHISTGTDLRKMDLARIAQFLILDILFRYCVR